MRVSIQAKRLAAVRRKQLRDHTASPAEQSHDPFGEFTETADHEDGDDLLGQETNQASSSAQAPGAEDPGPTPAKRLRLSGKQKYQQVAASVRELKGLVEREWVQHGKDSSRHTVRKTEVGSGSRAYRNLEVVQELRPPKVDTTTSLSKTEILKIHASHHKMQIRTVVFCKWCGHHASRKAQRLTKVCEKMPRHSNVAQQLRRMMRGLHPDHTVQEWPGGLSTKGAHPLINLDGV